MNLRRWAQDGFAAAVFALQLGVLVPWFGSGRGPGDGLVVQGAFAAAYAAAAVLLLLRAVQRRRLRWSRWMLWPLAYLALAAASLAWSDLPALTLRRVIALGGTLVFAVWLAETMDPRRLARTVAFALLGIAFASYLLLALMPQQAVHGAASAHAGSWRGILLHKNLLGREMALATTLTLGLAVLAPPRRRRFWVGMASLTALLVLGARSATGIGLMLAGGGAVAFVALPAADAWERVGRRALLIGAIAVVAVASGTFGVVALEALDRDATFSGRDRIWQETVDVLRARPWTGAGYGAFWEGPAGAEVSRRLGYTVGHAHNGLLQAAGSLGLPGVALLLVLYLGVAWRALRGPAFRSARPLTIGLLLHVAVLSVTDAIMSGPNSLAMTVAVAWAVMRSRGAPAAAPLAERAAAPRGSLQPAAAATPGSGGGPT